MANFRIYPGLFVRIRKDFKKIKENQVLQVMYVRFHVAFVGVNGEFPLDGSLYEPIYEEDKNGKT